MTEQPNPDLAVLLELWKGTAARPSERRSYEWKIAFGVWAGQLLAMGELISHVNVANRSSLHGWAFFGIYLGAGLAVALLHGMYVLRFIRTQNRRDALIAIAYEKRLGELVGFENPEIKPPSGQIVTPPHAFAFAMTFFLAIIGPVAIHYAS